MSFIDADTVAIPARHFTTMLLAQVVAAPGSERIFEQLLTAAGGDVDGVLVANDGLSLAAQAVLADNGLTLPTTGQDATVDGLLAWREATTTVAGGQIAADDTFAQTLRAFGVAAALLDRWDIYDEVDGTIYREVQSVRLREPK